MSNQFVSCSILDMFGRSIWPEGDIVIWPTRYDMKVKMAHALSRVRAAGVEDIKAGGTDGKRHRNPNSLYERHCLLQLIRGRVHDA